MSDSRFSKIVFDVDYHDNLSPHSWNSEINMLRLENLLLNLTYMYTLKKQTISFFVKNILRHPM